MKEAILCIGEVSEIEGRKVFIKVHKDKNSSDLLFDGDIIKNVSVGSYVEIKKGFLSIIGKADGEKLTESSYLRKDEGNQYREVDKNIRYLTISLVGYVGFNGKFIGGIKELPLIGNEAFILTEQKIRTIHNLSKETTKLHIQVAKTDTEEIPIDLPIDGIFNSHIAIFGNTGSGKSNTLAALYQGLFDVCGKNDKFQKNSQFLIFDFNGEYTNEECLTKGKKVYNLRTQDEKGNRISLSHTDMFDSETLSVLVEATDKTQKPFLKRALRLYNNAKEKDNYLSYLKGILLNIITDILRMADKDTALKLLDYMEEVLDILVDDRNIIDKLTDDIMFHNGNDCKAFKKLDEKVFFDSSPEAIKDTNIYKAADSITDDNLSNMTELSQFDVFLHLQLIKDLYRYKVQNDHIYPVINRFRSKQVSIDRVFKVETHPNFWDKHNCVVINLHDVNLDMRKTIPLLIAKNIYNAHKKENNKKSLNIIIDEAHNILSKTSFRETEDWKDYRLETFEEIIKEGRKFGVFVTISSQRPNDISDTIISQAHNYFIHQLVNQKDLLTIGNAVSYIDKITEESIPTLSVGTCIFSCIATPMPLKLKITELPDRKKPDSHTLQFKDIL